MNAVDTNVFIYSLDTDAPLKQTQAQKLLEGLAGLSGSTVVPWQVVGELLANLRKRESEGRITTAELEAHFRNFLALFPITVPGPGVLERYFLLYSRYSLSHWDAMLLAACKEIGVTTLYSEDLDAGTNYDGLTVVNPFV